MGLSINDTAPDFEADTTRGMIGFHEWIGDYWAVLFSHPTEFTRVCTTELGQVAKPAPEFERRRVKVIGLSVDSTDSYHRWADDIGESQGARPGYPIMGKVLWVIDSLRLTARHRVVTSANGKPGEDVMILNSLSDEQARVIFGEWKAVKPYIRIVPQPR